ncbi:hypothetical protein [Micromonospora sp. DT31]|uniref:hypothetical protein n=1 Tax=Micromonospora sp. DT31 TaxID=3393434 RepID=UPI003CF0F6EF
MDHTQEGELQESMEQLRELIGRMPDGMAERLCAEVVTALTRQEAGTTGDEPSTSEQ